MEDSALSGLTQLWQLIINSFSLSKIPNIDNVKKTLSSMNLVKNDITNIENDYFKDSVLMNVNIAYNNIKTIPDVCYINETVEVINLNHNKIILIDPVLKCPFPYLYRLSLTGNRIQQLGLTCEKRFTLWPSLDTLEVEDNQLNNLPGLYCEDMMRTKIGSLNIWAQNNLFVCNTSLGWLVRNKYEKYISSLGTVQYLWAGEGRRFLFSRLPKINCGPPRTIFLKKNF